MPSSTGETTSTNVSPSGHDRVAQAEVRDAGIVERLAERKRIAEVRDDRVEVARDEDGLPEPEHGRA